MSGWGWGGFGWVRGEMGLGWEAREEGEALFLYVTVMLRRSTSAEEACIR